MIYCMVCATLCGWGAFAIGRHEIALSTSWNYIKNPMTLRPHKVLQIMQSIVVVSNENAFFRMISMMRARDALLNAHSR